MSQTGNNRNISGQERTAPPPDYSQPADNIPEPPSYYSRRNQFRGVSSYHLEPERDSKFGLILALVVLVAILVFAMVALLTLISTGFFNFAPAKERPTPVGEVFPTPTSGQPASASVRTTFVAVPTATALPTDTPGPATPTVSPTTTVQPGGTAQQYFEAGNTAFQANDWDNAIANFEKIPTGDSLFSQVRPLLVRAYVNLANSNVSNQPPTLANAQKTVDLYTKALALDRTFSGLSDLLEKATNYQDGRQYYEARQWKNAYSELSQLYYGVKSANPASKYRDTADLLYATLIQLGDGYATQNQFSQARDSYKEASGLDVADKTVANKKLGEMEARLRVTPTPAPTPTRTCGSNFYARNVTQPNVPNVPDQGSSTIAGQVLNRKGAPVVGAVIRVIYGNYNFTASTDSSGNYQIGGLGRAKWTVVVVSAPGYSICTSLSSAVNLSGEAKFLARVDFVESVP